MMIIPKNNTLTGSVPSQDVASLVLDLEKAKSAQAKEIVDLKKRVKKLERKKKSRTFSLKDYGKLGRMNEEDMFGVNDLDGDEVIVDVTAVTTAEDVEVTTTTTNPQISKDKLTLAQILIEIKAAKPKARGVIVQELCEFKTTSFSQPSQLLQAKEKGKRIMVEPEKRIKKIKLDFMKRKREIGKRNIPPTKAQQRNLMCTYLKNIDGWKPNSSKKKSFDEIQKLCDSVTKRVNIFVDMNTEIVEERSKKIQTEVTEGSSKSLGDELEQESAKRQRLKKEDDYAELKRCLEIVPKDDDVTINATPLSSKSPAIVDYKIYKEGKKSYFKIIKADGNSQSYLTFGKMFKNFNREDLEVLWCIVEERFKKTKPVDDMDNLLFQTLKTMFEHHAEDNIWRY
nr:hypothetical protein [Tanacetum cinerariifolium]